eukprot:1577384-Amphidinium_carterae.1
MGPVEVMQSQLVAYMNTVLFPSLPRDKLTIRTRRELLTLGEALDAVMAGNVARSCDILVQRCRALELSLRQGTWDQAVHLELAGQADAGMITMSERAQAAKA